MSTMLLPPAIQTTLETAHVSLLVFAAACLANVEQAMKAGLRFPADKAHCVVALGEAPGYQSLASLTGHAGDVAPAVDRIPQGKDPCHIMFSSGTTGEPKGIVVAQSTRAMYGYG